MKRIVVLGSTGSIGRQTLDIVRAHPRELAVLGLAAGANLDLLELQAHEFRPALVCCSNGAQDRLRRIPGVRTASMEEMASHPDVDLVMVATTGRAGLLPTLRALRAGKAVALANKEVVVMAGEHVSCAARAAGAPLLPVDSEPSAIWQCLQGEERALNRIVLTASGGPFRTWPLDALSGVTPEQALRHPTWQMGKKITVDSATLMNKAFEVIEVHHLFDTPWERIEVVLHPQSIVHSLVEFQDGSVKAQLAPPDMRLPIQYALLYPRRLPNDTLPRLDLGRAMALAFEPLDVQRYPAFALAREVAARGGTYPAVLSGADEAAVELFLQERIPFTGIPTLVERVVAEHAPTPQPSLEDILAAEAWARRRAVELAGR